MSVLMWEPAVILPSQTVDRRRVTRMPEMRLVTAIFDDAVQSIICGADAQKGSRRREFLEARDWLWDDTRTHPFAFANVCDLLDLDVTAVRESLVKIITGPPRAAEEQHPDPLALTGVNESTEVGERSWTSAAAPVLQS